MGAICTAGDRSCIEQTIPIPLFHSYPEAFKKIFELFNKTIGCSTRNWITRGVVTLSSARQPNEIGSDSTKVLKVLGSRIGVCGVALDSEFHPESESFFAQQEDEEARDELLGRFFLTVKTKCVNRNNSHLIPTTLTISAAPFPRARLTVTDPDECSIDYFDSCLKFMVGDNREERITTLASIAFNVPEERYRPVKFDLGEYHPCPI